MRACVKIRGGPSWRSDKKMPILLPGGYVVFLTGAVSRNIVC